jgi:hypothetical protein
MSATTIGNVAFGLIAETGIFAQSTTYTANSEQKWVRDADGDEVAGSIYNPTWEWSTEGQINTGGALTSYVLGAAVTMANIPSNIHTNGTTNGKSYVTGFEITKSAEDHQMVNISGVIKPFS